MKKLAIAMAAALIGLSTTVSAQWVNLNGQAASYDASRNSVLTVDKAPTTGVAICFVDNDDPVFNLGGDYRLVVDGRYVTLTGVSAGGAWVTAQAIDGDVRTAVNMLKNGSRVKLQFCFGGECNTIFSSGLKDSARTINNVTL